MRLNVRVGVRTLRSCYTVFATGRQWFMVHGYAHWCTLNAIVTQNPTDSGTEWHNAET